MNQLRNELIAASIPAMAGRLGGRVALGAPYKTATGQWAIEANGTPLWHGTGDPTPAPDQTMLDLVASIKASHVPVPPPEPDPDVREVLKALVRTQRGRPDPADQALLDRAEGL